MKKIGALVIVALLLLVVWNSGWLNDEKVISAIETGIKTALSLLEQRIKTSDPRNILTRGFSLVTDEKGVVVNSAAKLHQGQRLNILFADGSVEVEIIK